MRRTGVALARAAAAQLAVNAARLVAFRADDVQAAEFGDAGAEFDVRAAAGHVGGDGHRAALAGARDDFGLLLVIFRVEDGMDDAFALEHARKLLADFDGNRADENRPALGVDLLDFVEDGVEFFAPGFIDRIVARPCGCTVRSSG